MKLKLIAPRPKRVVRNGSRFRMPPFGLTVVAAMTPKEFEITLEDENVEDVNFDEKADLVGISSFTSNVTRGYEIADEFRRRGIPVVMGGFHVSAMPDEALEHADAVVIGEAENIWLTVLEDFKQGKMKGKYRATDFHDMAGLPRPRLDLLKHPGRYSLYQMVQTTRGCPYKCEFCSTSTFWGYRFRSRPVDEVIEEIRQLNPKKHIFLVDDDVAAVPNIAKELFRKLIPLKIKWIAQAGIGIAQDDELLKLAKESGCKFLFIGFESLEEQSLKTMHKNQNHPDRYREIINKIHDHGIVVQAAMVAGLDNDRKDIFRKIDAFMREADIDALQFNILYPYPGTQIRERLLQEGRVTSNDWNNYVFSGVNYLPHSMSQQDLHDGYRWLLRKHSSYPSMIKKTIRAMMSGRSAKVTILLNLGLRRSYKQILTVTDAIRTP